MRIGTALEDRAEHGVDYALVAGWVSRRTASRVFRFRSVRLRARGEDRLDQPVKVSGPKRPQATKAAMAR